MQELQLSKLNYLVIGAGKVGLSISEKLKSMGINLRIYAHNSNLYKSNQCNINRYNNNPQNINFNQTNHNSINPIDLPISQNIINNNDFIFDLSPDTYLPDFIIISVPDKNISSVSLELSENYNKLLKSVPIIHTSGIYPSDLLNECKNCGAITASVHPYQTFYSPSLDLLSGIGWGIESEFDKNIFIEFVKMLGGNYHILKSKEEKIKYHLSAVMSSNFLNSLLSSVISSLKNIGLSFDDFALPIIEQTLRNSINSYHLNSNRMPLTGPIARGDIESIKLHLSAITDSPEILIQYVYHCLATLEIAKNQNIIDENVYLEIKKVLHNYL